MIMMATTVKELPKLCRNCGYAKSQHVLTTNHVKQEEILYKNNGHISQKEFDSCEYLQCPKTIFGWEYTE